MHVVCRKGASQALMHGPAAHACDGGHGVVQVAVREGLMPSAGGALRLEEVIDMHLAPWLQAQPSRSMLPALSAADVAEGLQRFGETVRLRAGEELYAAGDDASAMYIVLSGEIMCEWDFDAFTRCAVVTAAQPQT